MRILPYKTNFNHLYDKKNIYILIDFQSSNPFLSNKTFAKPIAKPNKE